MPVDNKQIEEWKKKHPGRKIMHLEFEDGKECYLVQPSRQQLKFISSRQAEGTIGMVEAILENCWLDGDNCVREDTGYLAGLPALIDDLVGTVTAKVKNL